MAQTAATAPQTPLNGAAGAVPSRPPVRTSPRHTYGAIDLGTNNCRLLVARPAEQGFVVVDAFSRVVRLGEGLAASGRISDAAMDRALSALSVCADKLRRRKVSIARSVATEACRRAVNGRKFIERVHNETGIRLDIIAPEEEARLAMLGCHRLLEPGDGPALIFDIGGGSTEVVLVDTDGVATPRIKSWWSAPWGVVSLTESETHSKDLPGPEERLAAYGRMRERARHAFRRFAELLPQDKTDIRLMGTSGTVTTLASVHLALPSYDRKAIDGLMVPTAAMRDISERMSRMSHAERSELPCIGSDRADLVVAGCAILEAIMDIWPAKTLGVADRGIREGILRSLMARDGHRI
ncbi:Ppx/GppA phosphatase family protein [Allosphingosinicella indica]|uniref:Exopolyphosphatase / guanosine-5'-triphosphate,3'-diphosphate pyrophosphatase n=1 Tax=Allosphingosinicella indica TaxID=941907 RepID=A0A1X7GG76_9SPHN|nr:Ppx/GppA phosphatase family protein [Allosphingosinicella indica]SMF69320.1 exopolyphosphatase / guanosine-5'-triphosphate,3'-diphosphate pyrophosphatase [Allosphingosinicella indica]